MTDSVCLSVCLQVIAAALMLGLPLGFITNAPDQMKTNIQKGQFLNMCVLVDPEA